MRKVASNCFNVPCSNRRTSTSDISFWRWSIVACACKPHPKKKKNKFCGVGSSSPWTRPSAPRCGDKSKASTAPATMQVDRSKVGIVRKDVSGVAIDWVIGRSFSHKGDGSMYNQAYVTARCSFTRAFVLCVCSSEVRKEAGPPFEWS